MPTTILRYRIEHTMAPGGINFKLYLVFPTTFNMMKVSYFAQLTTSSYGGYTAY